MIDFSKFAGKTVKEIKCYDQVHSDDEIEIHFTDGTFLIIRADGADDEYGTFYVSTSDVNYKE